VEVSVDLAELEDEIGIDEDVVAIEEDDSADDPELLSDVALLDELCAVVGPDVVVAEHVLPFGKLLPTHRC
jgi:hypothetical protein